MVDASERRPVSPVTAVILWMLVTAMGAALAGLGWWLGDDRVGAGAAVGWAAAGVVGGLIALSLQGYLWLRMRDKGFFPALLDDSEGNLMFRSPALSALRTRPALERGVSAIAALRTTTGLATWVLTLMWWGSAALLGAVAPSSGYTLGFVSVAVGVSVAFFPWPGATRRQQQRWRVFVKAQGEGGALSGAG